MEIATWTEDGQARVRVSDHGVGMDEEVRARIFDPFFSTKPGHGMGLGLGLAFGVIKRHRGTIEATSELGVGSTFQLSFPASDAAARPAPAELATSGNGGPDVKARVLVIDDQGDLLQVVSTILLARGHRVETADCGRAGIERIQSDRFDVVITDLGMPDVSGWEVADTAKRIAPGMPVVLMTGWASEIDETKLAGRRVDLLLPKPFRSDQLLGAVQRVVRGAARVGA